MFVRTKRLMLRPGWPEDAEELANAIGHESVVRNLSRVPWPYTQEDAKAFLADIGGVLTARFLVLAHDAGNVRLIGCVGVQPTGRNGAYELGYWLTPDAWGRGYATEAGQGALAAVRSIGVRRVEAGHAIDNPASGRVLRKLGFRPTGEIRRVYSRARGQEVDTLRFARELAGDAPDPEVSPDPMRLMAA